MAAECLWCKKGTTGSVPNAIGAANNPIGCCLKCNALICGHHAQRDSRKQEFKCFDCLFISLIHSALAKGDHDSNELRNLDEVFFRRDFFRSDKDVYGSFADFKIGNEAYAGWFREAEKMDIQKGMPRELKLGFKNLKGDAKQFLGMAALIAARIIKPKDREQNVAAVYEASPFLTALINIVKSNVE